MKARTIAALTLSAVLCGCGGQVTMLTDCVAPFSSWSKSSALSAVQGSTLQGTSLQGTTLQGTTLQGTTLQGSSLQGTTMQGRSLQGRTLQGISLQGAMFQGVSFQGVGRNASSQQVEAMQGIQLQGSRRKGALARTLGRESEPLQGLHLRGSELIAVSADGELLRGKALVGLRLLAVTDARDLVELELVDLGTHPEQDDVFTYAIALVGGPNICGAGAKGLFVEGVWDERGQRHERLPRDDGDFDVTFSCTSGVIAKCVGWGYKPWELGADVHQTCTRMARADYCGDGVPHTQDGTLIDLYDSFGLQRPEADDLYFEAGWGPEGARCVNKTRYQEIRVTDGADVMPSCWDEKPRCADFEAAKLQGAVLGNSSAWVERPVCE